MVGRSFTDGRDSTRQVMFTLTSASVDKVQLDAYHLQILGTGQRGNVPWLCSDVVHDWLLEPGDLDMSTNKTRNAHNEVSSFRIDIRSDTCHPRVFDRSMTTVHCRSASGQDQQLRLTVEERIVESQSTSSKSNNQPSTRCSTLSTPRQPSKRITAPSPSPSRLSSLHTSPIELLSQLGECFSARSVHLGPL